MKRVGRHGRFRGRRGWWAAAVRTLALVFALTTVAPTLGIADDLAFHAVGHGAAAAMTAIDLDAATDASNPGLDSHVHCGCHQAVPTVAVPIAPSFDNARPCYARPSEAPRSIASDRLPRPPRA